MCGIGGILRKDFPLDKSILKKLAAHLSHRGPDETGYFIKPSLGLVHTRLSIIDLEGGKQPLCAKNDEIVLVANGEIYNYKELREQLHLRGRNSNTLSDCEIIIHAYMEFGLDFIEKIAGMFAFALWDQNKRRLILGRDRLGIKPLYFTEQGGDFIFSSELKALVPFLRKREIDPRALSEALQNQFTAGRNTMFKAIKRVLPGELLVIEGETKRFCHYWNAANISTLKLDYSNAARMFSPLFETVMLQHMRADVPYGIFLSGGLDSATVLSMLSRMQTRKMLSFSVGYKDVRMLDELEDAEFVAKLFNTRHVPIKLGRDEMLRRVPHMVWHTDEFMWDYACLPTSFLAEYAKKYSLKVVFTGEGGDEVFAGYGRYRKSLPEILAKRIISPRSGGFRTRGRWRRPWPKKVFGPELLRHVDAYKFPFRDAWSQAPDKWRYIQKAQFTDITTELPNDLLVKVDRMLMAYGVEGRVPFLDHRIVEFGLSLPRKLKIVPHFGKVFLRRWAEQYIPRTHLWKRKRGFHVPVGEWLKGDLLNGIEERLLQNSAIREWFNPSGVKGLFLAQREGAKASREIWSLMHFAIWHNLYVESGCKYSPSPSESLLDFI